MSRSASRGYPTELRERMARMDGEIRADYESDWAAMTQVLRMLVVSMPETVRKWCRTAFAASQCHD